jgi:hypothetical protein
MNLWDSSRADELTETSVEKQRRENSKTRFGQSVSIPSEKPGKFSGFWPYGMAVI